MNKTSTLAPCSGAAGVLDRKFHDASEERTRSYPARRRRPFQVPGNESDAPQSRRSPANTIKEIIPIATCIFVCFIYHAVIQTVNSDF